MPRILPLLIVSLALLLTGCDDSKNRLSVLSGPTMGTTWSVKYTGTPDEGVEALKGDIEAALEQVNAEMSTYRPDSSLSRFNDAEPGDSAEVDSTDQRDDRPGQYANFPRSVRTTDRQNEG